MSEKGSSRNRWVLRAALGAVASVILVTVVAIKLLPHMLLPKVVYKKRPDAELVLPPNSPASEVLVASPATPQPADSAKAIPPSAVTPPTTQDVSVQDKAVDGGEYIAELGRTAGLTEQERAKMQPFLEMIARSQELVARVDDPERRADMSRRLQYQATYGMKLRVAPEKRERVADALQKGVPRLVFPNAKKPEVITQKVTNSPG
jgi:hypothetical protein